LRSVDFLRPKGRVASRLRAVFDPDPFSSHCLNLASGNDYRAGWDNADLYAPRADVRFNLEKLPWPFAEQAYDYVLADQIVEHLPDRIGAQDGLLAVLGEIHRVLKPGGRVYIGVPHAVDPETWRNPTHLRAFVPSTLKSLDANPGNGGDASVLYQAGYSFRILDTVVLRRLRITRFFDSSYHVPKYVKRHVNLGAPWGIVWIMERPG